MTAMTRIEEIQHFAENKYAWPGGYPMYAITEDNACLCHDCTVKEGKVIGDEDGWIDPQWHVVDTGINWEDTELYCEHCYNKIECAYEQPTKG